MGLTPIRLLIVDDTAAIRAVIRAVAATDARLKVVGEARDAYEARALIKALSPDVITLDVEMPRMNGLDFLDRLMRLRPLPVVMVSTRTSENSAAAIQALALGAVDCVDVSRLEAEPGVRRRLVETLVAAGSATVAPRRRAGAGPAEEFAWNGRIVLLGSSTGGVDALERVLRAFPPNCPPTVIAQHMPASFLQSFARRLDGLVAPRVGLARGGEGLRQGTVLIAAGGMHHLQLRRTAPLAVAEVPAGPEDPHVPSVERLFRSALPVAPRVVAGLLTGMGRDGADALLALRLAGARTLAQSAESCVIDGMPRAAREIGAAREVLPLDAIGPHLVAACALATAERT